MCLRMNEGLPAPSMLFSNIPKRVMPRSRKEQTALQQFIARPTRAHAKSLAVKLARALQHFFAFKPAKGSPAPPNSIFKDQIDRFARHMPSESSSLLGPSSIYRRFSKAKITELFLKIFRGLLIPVHKLPFHNSPKILKSRFRPTFHEKWDEIATAEPLRLYTSTRLNKYTSEKPLLYHPRKSM